MHDRGASFLPEMEAEIQARASKKDKHFVLSDLFKEHIRFVRMQDGFKICAVDQEWVKNNLSVVFEHGGHGYVHEFIPIAPIPEIWVSTHHPKDCICKNVRQDRRLSENYFNSTVRHEISEFWKMARGMPFLKAHQEALQEEIAAGYPDPYAEVE